MHMKRMPWVPPPEVEPSHVPLPPPHPYGHVPPHLVIEQGIAAVSAQVAEVQAAVEALDAAVQEIRSKLGLAGPA